MDAMLIATIARHYPVKGHAERIIAALELVTGCAAAHLEDLMSGVEEGLYDEADNRDRIDTLRRAINTLEG